MSNETDSKPIWENREFIAFARRHAYMMKEGFFDGVEREVFVASDCLCAMLGADTQEIQNDFNELRELTAQVVSQMVGITFAEAMDALGEWNRPTKAR